MENALKELISNAKWYAIGGALFLVLTISIYVMNQVFGWTWNALLEWIKNKFLVSHRISNSRKKIGDIKEITEKTRQIFGADRAYVAEFHNGQYFASRFPRFRVSQTYESLNENVDTKALDYRDVDISLLWDSVGLFYIKDANELPQGVTILKKNLLCSLATCSFPRRVLLFDVEKMKNDYTKALLEKYKVKYMLCSVISDLKTQNIIGYLGVDFCDDSFIQKFDNKEFTSCMVCKHADQISLAWSKK